MKNSFAIACTEVLDVLKHLPQNEYERIPKDEIEFLESQKDSSFNVQGINLSKEANALIIILWEKYFASQNEKERLYNILKQNYQKEEKRKKELYNYDNLFKEKEKESTELVEVKNKKWYERILDFFKKNRLKFKK